MARTARNAPTPPTYHPDVVEDDGTLKPEITLGGGPETPREMMARTAPLASARADSEETIEDQRSAQNDGRWNRRQRLQADKNDAYAAHAMLSRDTNASDSHMKRAQKEVDKAVAKIAAFDAQGTAESALIPPTLMPMLRDFFSSLTRITNGKGVEDAGTTDTLPKGKTMIEHADAIKTEIYTGRDALKWITNAPPTRDEFRNRLRSHYKQAAGLAESCLRDAAGHHYDRGHYDYFAPGARSNGRFTMWGYSEPSIAVANGLGDIIKIPDGFATLLAIMGDEILEKMIDKALEKYGDQTPLTMAQRIAKRLEADEALLALERKHAFWVYAGREKNIRIDHVSEPNPFAVLDVVIRK